MRRDCSSFLSSTGFRLVSAGEQHEPGLAGCRSRYSPSQQTQCEHSCRQRGGVLNFNTGYTIITGFVFCGYTGFVPLGEEAGQCCTLPPAKSAAGSALIPTENPLSLYLRKSSN